MQNVYCITYKIDSTNRKTQTDDRKVQARLNLIQNVLFDWYNNWRLNIDIERWVD